MILKDAIQKLGYKNSLETAKDLANEMGLDWDGCVSFIFKIIATDPERIPGKIGSKADNEVSVIRKWLKRYQSGMTSRASRRTSNPPGTVADPIIEVIVGARLTNLDTKDLEKITYAHRLGMSAENILGLMLEEYLAENLKELGWHCAWGETVKSVDFVKEDGSLLQIKNRSNSENSSSSSVRNGTKIEKWYRIKADRIEYMWDALNKICGTSNLSEKAFVKFVNKTLKRNPQCLAVEKDNPWEQQ
ncbi:MAG: SinI family restriction endonuclease [Methyloprofundus sp.]|nr:SinI family restriction endonuclease [Methyloprofundus sp.]